MSDSNLSALSRLSFSRRSALAGLTGLGAVALAGCQTGDGGSSHDSSSGGSDERGEFPRTIKHAFGETEIESAPERVATVSWANQDAALALGVVPVGMPTIDFGGNENGSTDWFDDKLEEVGGEAPEQYSETDGIDFDAIAALNPAPVTGVTRWNCRTECSARAPHSRHVRAPERGTRRTSRRTPIAGASRDGAGARPSSDR